MEYDYPVFSICDGPICKYNGEDIEIGEYIIDDIIIEQLGGIKINKQIVPYILVDYLLKKKYIDKSKILAVKKASYRFDKKIIADFIKLLLEIFPKSDNPDEDQSKYFKILACCFSGMLGRRYSTIDYGFVTNDYKTMCASYFQYNNKNNYHWNSNTIDDLHFIRLTQKNRIFGDNSQIYRQILGQGMIQLLDMIEIVFVPNQSKIIGYNTDAVFIENPKQFTILENKKLLEYPKYREEKWKPKLYKQIEDKKKPLKIPNNTKIYWKVLNEDDDNKNKSFICIGPGGSGKSEKLKAYYDNDSLVLTLTNKACDSLRKKGLEEIYTFDTYFREKEKISDSIKKIQIDEFSMMPTSWLIIIYKLKLKNPKLIVQLYGDPNQCKQVCKHNRYFDYLGKKCVSFICNNNVIRKKYIEATARYDKELYEVLEYLLETGKMHPKLDNRPINHNLQSNIVKHNKIRDEINKKFANEWFIGMKIIGNKFNDKSKGIFNSKLYYITDIKDNKIKYTDDIKYLNYLKENKFSDTNEKYLYI
jgi:hypothetical protein